MITESLLASVFFAIALFMVIWWMYFVDREDELE